jgi:hypothetical protein
MRTDHHETGIRTAARRVRLFLRFGVVNVHAYAAVLRIIIAERLWLVPVRVRSPSRGSQ